MAINDIYALKDKQVLLGQNILNAYHYLQVEGEGGADDLAAAFRDTVIAEIRLVQNAALSHVEVEVQNIADPLDFHVLPISPAIVGADIGNASPPFTAWGFKKPRTRTDIKNGSFRIAGVTSTLVSDGVATAGALAELQALGEEMGTRLSDLEGNSWDFGYLAVPEGSTTPIFIRTVLPDYLRVTTQNSRKFNVGQ